MPIKKLPNMVSLRNVDQKEILSFVTNNKRNHFDSESKLFDMLDTNIKGVNNVFSTYLSTHPVIAIHVSCGNKKLLTDSKQSLHDAINIALNTHLKQT